MSKIILESFLPFLFLTAFSKIPMRSNFPGPSSLSVNKSFLLAPSRCIFKLCCDGFEPLDLLALSKFNANFYTFRPKFIVLLSFLTWFVYMHFDWWFSWLVFAPKQNAVFSAFYLLVMFQISKTCEPLFLYVIKSIECQWTPKSYCLIPSKRSLRKRNFRL